MKLRNCIYNQHIKEIVQKLENSAVEKVFELTHGQPWLVNALA